MLKHRLLFGAILIAIVFGLIVADDRWTSGDAPAFMKSIGMVSYNGIIATLMLAVLAALGTVELGRLFTAAGHPPLPRWTIGANIALVLIPFVASNGESKTTGLLNSADFAATVVCLAAAFIIAGFSAGARRKTEGGISFLATTLFAVLYLGLLPQFMVRIRMNGGEGAAWLLLYFIFTVKLCDMGAYFTGRAIGRRKLIEWLSPNKTIEGLAGGVVVSTLFAVGVAVMAREHIAALPDPTTAIAFGILLALLGQAGDLLESLIKRDAGAKDSAQAVPSFGGVLDILDSPLFAAPLAWWMLA